MYITITVCLNITILYIYKSYICIFIIHLLPLFLLFLLSFSPCAGFVYCFSLQVQLKCYLQCYYANILLCNAPDRVTARLERVQRSAARLIYGIHRYQRISITAVLHELHWLPVVIRIQYKVLVTVFKAYHSGTPQYLADLIKKHSPVRKLRSSHNPNLLEEPKYTGEKFGSKSFCVAGPRFWNRLPAELREISSLDTFKKHLKTHLFQKHYYTEN